MPTVTVSFRFRKREIPLVEDSPPRYNLPEDWQEVQYDLQFESKQGIQQVPGAIDAASATRRHVCIFSPREWVESGTIADWPTFVFQGVDHTVSGTLVLTDPLTEGAIVFNGDDDPPARAYFIEAEEMANVGKWRGGWRSLFWRW